MEIMYAVCGTGTGTVPGMANDFASARVHDDTPPPHSYALSATRDSTGESVPLRPHICQ
jgi:hypothetical protein